MVQTEMVAKEIRLNTVGITIIDAMLLSFKEAKTLLTRTERAYNHWWWLRSPGYNSFIAASVRSDGDIDGHGRLANGVSDAVRPALKIKNIKSSNLQIGDKFEFGGKTFKIISKNIAFCEGDIGIHCFNKDFRVQKTNDYKKSDVKKFVDEWFEHAKACNI